MTGPLSGLRVIDAGTPAAGPLVATWLGEYGAEVIEVEQPDGGDPVRQWGAQRDGVGLMWKSLGRTKTCVTPNLRESSSRPAPPGRSSSRPSEAAQAPLGREGS